MCRKHVSKCGDANAKCQTVFEVSDFVACNMPENQNDLILLHVAGNKIHHQKCCKTKLFCCGRI